MACSFKRPRVAIVVSHPIQHFCPQYASLAKAKDWDLCVFFGSSAGKEAYFAEGFGQTISWANLYLDEFPHVFLTNEAIQSSAALDAPNLDSELAHFRPDVVIIYGYWQKLQRRAKSWAIANGKKLYFISDTELHGVSSLLRRFAKAAYGRYWTQGVSRVLTVGNANEVYYSQCGISLDRMTRMNFPIDIRVFAEGFTQKTALRQKVRREWGMSDDEIVIGNVAKFESWKRQGDLIEAIARVPATLKLRVVLAGSGPDDLHLRKLAENHAPDRVIFAGFVNPEGLPAYYAGCDIYAHVSSYEPHSLAISEANYMGLPIIVSRACGSYGPNDDLQPGRNGLIYPTGAIDKLASAIQTLAANPDLRSSFGAMSRLYSVSAQSHSHGEFLRNALAADGLFDCSFASHSVNQDEARSCDLL